jgi:uncharacterized membrane protein (UPF0136 family)
MESGRFLLKFGSFYQIARRHITEDSNLYSHHCRNLKVYAVFFFNFKGRVSHSRVVVMLLLIVIIVIIIYYNYNNFFNLNPQHAPLQ